MDSVTQIVLGAAVGEVALGRKVGNKAILWGAIAGTIPDLDVVGRFFLDDITALEWHRGFSHSLLFCLLAAPILGYLVQRFSKNKIAGFKGWTRLMFLALVTHPLLDCHTAWGTQFLWPFDIRIAYNNIFVIDPLYTLPFLIFVILAMTQARDSLIRRKLNTLGLIISSAYMAITLLLKAYTHQIFTQSLEDQKVEYSRMSSRPTPLNSVLWTANVETADSFLIGYTSIFDKNKQVQFNAYPKNQEAISGIKEQDQIARLIKITQNWYLIQEKADSLYLCDLRFGELQINNHTGNFVFKHKLIQIDGKWVIQQLDPGGGDPGAILTQVWFRMWGNNLAK